MGGVFGEARAARGAVGLVVLSVMLSATVAGSAPKSYRRVGSDTPQHLSNPGLFAVSCPTTTWCAAVGHDLTDEVQRTSVAGLAIDTVLGERNRHAFIEHWDGTDFRLVPVADLLSQDGLFDVSCPATTFCMAVGADPSGPMAEAWNGALWSRAPKPLAGKTTGWESISCTSSVFCVEVGEPRDIQSWNGAAWTRMSAPPKGGMKDLHVFDVSCTSEQFCMAVGRTAPDGVITERLIGGALVQHAVSVVWDGRAWRLVDAVQPLIGSDAWFNGVSCVSETYCVAVGAHRIPSIVAVGGVTNVQPLIEEWNGQTWRIDKVRGTTLLANVSCVGVGDCTAVGVDAATFQPVVLTGLHGRWASAHTPVVRGVGTLVGVSCSGSGFCAASGQGDGQSLAEVAGA